MPSTSDNLTTQFKNDLLNKELEKLVSLWIIEKLPILFEGNHELFVDWKYALAKKIDVDMTSIILVGSSSVGISLNPYKNYRLFNERSDVDVAVISEYYFNEAWRFFRHLGSRIHSLSPKEKQSIEDHVTKYIYWGTIATDNILPLFPFGYKWQSALNEMSLVHPTTNRTMKIRLYKDFESLRGYHLNNLRELRNKLLVEEN